jgi:hypothetical protein
MNSYNPSTMENTRPHDKRYSWSTMMELDDSLSSIGSILSTGSGDNNDGSASSLFNSNNTINNSGQDSFSSPQPNARLMRHQRVSIAHDILQRGLKNLSLEESNSSLLGAFDLDEEDDQDNDDILPPPVVQNHRTRRGGTNGHVSARRRQSSNTVTGSKKNGHRSSGSSSGSNRRRRSTSKPKFPGNLDYP